MFAEAAGVLYGENEFLYLLRDSTNHVTDIVAVGQDDSPDYASDAEEQPAGATARRATRRGRPGAGGAAPAPLYQSDINLDRYVQYIRRVSIEAEHNRFDDEAQARAAAAVQTFTRRYVWRPEHRNFCTRLARLELRVVPMWERGLAGRPPRHGGGDFTFLSWFAEHAPLMRAVRALSCDALVVRLLPPPLANARGRPSRRRLRAAEEEEQGPPSFAHELSMYHNQVDRLVRDSGYADPWAADDAMQEDRAARVAAMEEQFARLRDTLEAVCWDPVYGERGGPKGGEGEEDESSGEEDGDGWEEEAEEEEILVEQDDEDDEDYEE